MANVLLYNIGKEKLSRLAVLFARSGIRWRVVEKSEYALPLALLSAPQGVVLPGEAGESFEDELLVMNDFSRAQLSALLDAMRRAKVSIPLKAIVTETNATWTSVQLHRELCAERDAIEKGSKAHTV